MSEEGARRLPFETAGLHDFQQVVPLAHIKKDAGGQNHRQEKDHPGQCPPAEFLIEHGGHEETEHDNRGDVDYRLKEGLDENADELRVDEQDVAIVA